MQIIKSEVMGFCFGVRRAVETAESALQKYGKGVYSLGPLIHNENALKELKEKGLLIADEKEISTIKDGSVVIIRAHGVAPDLIETLKNKKCTVIDATCPRVKANQKMVSRYTSAEDYIILTGDKNHGEVIGLAGYAKSNFIQIQNYDEAEKVQLPSELKGQIVLLSQTTYNPLEFSKIESLLKSRYPQIKVQNTICPATEERQNALLDLCSKVDALIVIGGKNSANTKRLYQTAKENCKFALHIQDESEIPDEIRKYEKIGITAGASTPDKIISLVETALNNMV
ncbi:MAG: 4-hydroxy-3-methylbut-2-enyl diphosphate reductase [Treponema sp.]|nr:4-hydroxy-3-methylbut-2-enyl diphosphate reductase [Treponema sp.]